MSFIDIPNGDAKAAKHYEEDAYYSGYYGSPNGVLFESGAIYSAPELTNTVSPGDNTTINLYGKLGGVGRGENEALEGNEVSPSTGTFTMVWNELYQAELVASENNVKQMRIRQDLFDGGVSRVFDWQMDRLAWMTMNQAGGNTATTITVEGTAYTGTTDLLKITGHNTAVAPSTGRHFRVNARTTDELVVAGDELTLDTLDNAKATIKNAYPQFEPIGIVNGNYIFSIGFLNPIVMNGLRQDAAGAIQWYPNALAMVNGGDMGVLKDGIVGKSGYVYNEMLLFEERRVPLGVNSSSGVAVSDVYRSTFFGKNALVAGSPFGLTLDDEDVPLQLMQESFDYARWRGVAGGSKLGFKKFRGVESEDNNAYVVVSYQV